MLITLPPRGGQNNGNNLNNGDNTGDAALAAYTDEKGNTYTDHSISGTEYGGSQNYLDTGNVRYVLVGDYNVVNGGLFVKASTVAFDLNGHTLTLNGSLYCSSSDFSRLTIMDSSVNKTGVLNIDGIRGNTTSLLTGTNAYVFLGGTYNIGSNGIRSSYNYGFDVNFTGGVINQSFTIDRVSGYSVQTQLNITGAVLADGCSVIVNASNNSKTPTAPEWCAVSNYQGNKWVVSNARSATKTLSVGSSTTIDQIQSAVNLTSGTLTINMTGDWNQASNDMWLYNKTLSGVPFSAYCSVIWNLNGHTWSNPYWAYFAKLTIRDTAGGGKIAGNTYFHLRFDLVATYTWTLESGTIENLAPFSFTSNCTSGISLAVSFSGGKVTTTSISQMIPSTIPGRSVTVTNTVFSLPSGGMRLPTSTTTTVPAWCKVTSDSSNKYLTYYNPVTIPTNAGSKTVTFSTSTQNVTGLTAGTDGSKVNLGCTYTANGTTTTYTNVVDSLSNGTLKLQASAPAMGDNAYTITATPKSDSLWTDGTNTAKTLCTLKILRATLPSNNFNHAVTTYSATAAPAFYCATGFSSDKATITYRGNNDSWNYGVKTAYDSSTGKVVLNTGAAVNTYSVYATPTKNYQWSDATTDKKKIGELVVLRAGMGNPSKVTPTLTYSTAAQSETMDELLNTNKDNITLSTSNTKITAAGNTATIAANTPASTTSYKVYATPTANYAWTTNQSPVAAVSAWTKYSNASAITTSGNVVTFKTAGGYEVLGIPLSVKASTTYWVSFNVVAPNFNLFSTAKGLLCGVTADTPPTGLSTVNPTNIMGSREIVPSFNGYVEIPFTTNSTTTTVYLILNGGYIEDGQTASFTFTNMYLKTKDYAQKTVAEITINKDTPDITTAPSVKGSPVYGAKYSSYDINAGVAENTNSSAVVKGTWDYDVKTNTFAVGDNSVTIKFSPTDTTNYKETTKVITVTADKAKPTVTAPSVSGTPVYGEKYSSHNLTGGTAKHPTTEATIAGSWKYKSETSTYVVGQNSVKVYFEVTDTAHYYDSDEVVLTVTANRIALGTPTEQKPTGWTFSTAARSVTLTALLGTYQNNIDWAYLDGNNQATSYLTRSGSTLTVAANTPVGTYTVKATPKANYGWTADSYSQLTVATITIAKNTPTVTNPTVNGAPTVGSNYNAYTINGTVTNSNSGAVVAGEWKYRSGSTQYALGQNTVLVYFQPTDTKNYNNSADITLTVTVLPNGIDYAAYTVSTSDKYSGLYNYAYALGWELTLTDLSNLTIPTNKTYYLWGRTADGQYVYLSLRYVNGAWQSINQ